MKVNVDWNEWNGLMWNGVIGDPNCGKNDDRISNDMRIEMIPTVWMISNYGVFVVLLKWVIDELNWFPWMSNKVMLNRKIILISWLMIREWK